MDEVVVEKTYFQKSLESAQKEPLDFMKWEQVLKQCDHETYENYAMAHESFLELYPYCFEYWEKYAQKSLKELKSSTDIYEKAVAKIPYCVDIWLYYLRYANSSTSEPSSIVQLYERALTYTSINPKSKQIWCEYIQIIETTGSEEDKLNIYKKILSTPHPSLQYFWTEFTKINNDETSEIYIEMKNLHQSNYQLYSELYEFEERFKKHFFHVVPVSEDELQNWRYYLSKILEENENNNNENSENTNTEQSISVSTTHNKKMAHELIIQTFERCIMVCCNYTEFWEKYIDYLITYTDKETAKLVCDHSLSMYLKYSPNFLFWIGSINEVYQLYDDDFYTRAYDMQKPTLEILVKYINYLVRTKQFTRIIEIVKAHIEGTYYNMNDKEDIVEFLGQLALSNEDLQSAVYGLYRYLIPKTNTIITKAFTYCSMVLPDQITSIWDELTGLQKQSFGRFYLNVLDTIGNPQLLLSTRKEIYNLNSKPSLKRPRESMGQYHNY